MKLHAVLKAAALLAAVIAGFASRSDPGIITLPAGLSPDGKYRLVFVTSTMGDASSSNIADYNSFVSGVAASSPDLLGLGATWTAIGSTETMNAIDNIGTSLSTVGIYRLDGVKIANGTAGLFSGTILSPIYYNQQGGGPRILLAGYGPGPIPMARPAMARSARCPERRQPGPPT